MNETKASASKRPDAKTIEALKAEHGDVLEAVSVDDVTIIVRPPNRGEWKRFRAAAQDQKKRSDAPGQLLRDVLVWPSLKEWDEILECKPALDDTIAAEVAEMAGAVEGATRKKL